MAATAAIGAVAAPASTDMESAHSCYGDIISPWCITRDLAIGTF